MLGNIIKEASLSLNASVSEADLQKINEYALEPLTADQVFTFKIMAGDNGTDDRNYEPFSSKAILDMANLYKGKPMIWDHGRGTKGSEQIARIYDAEAVQTGKTMADGTNETQLVLHAYMPILESNKDLISEIKAGIKREVSTRVGAGSLICSVCGQDQMKSYCRHWAGRTYEGKTCLMTIDSVKDVLEVSFVGVPAQPRAGTVKAYNPNIPEAKPEDFPIEKKAPDTTLAEMELFLMAEKAEGEDDE